jgi:micrococcal nuclease
VAVDGAVTIERFDNGEIVELASADLSERDARDVRRITGAEGSEISARVVAVTDGDTFSIASTGGTLTVRLAHVDAPAPAEPFGRQAERLLRDQILNQKVTIQIQGRDTDGNPTARVHNGKSVVNQELVRFGFAKCLTRCSDKTLLRLERDARVNQLGIWSEAQELAIPSAQM